MKCPTLLLLLLLTFETISQDGVSIGRLAPDPSAVFHITSPSNNKGVIFPFSVPATIRDITNPYDGLFIYDSIFHRFAYYRKWNSDQARSDHSWMYLNPWDTEQINPDNTGDVNEDITSISTPYEVRINNDLSANHLDGFGVVPIGGIIMWSGPVSDIPDNYRLCAEGEGTYTVNGNTYTIPNLVGRFIRAAASPDVAAGGGVNTNTTTGISYVETPQYRIGGSDCQTFEFIYRASIIVPCDFPEGTSNEEFVLTKAAASCYEVFFELLETIPSICNIPPDTDIEPSCTQTPNPNYYQTNPDCENEGVVELNVVTNMENRPLFYDLAYIIRVE